jgi:hypothetical protein
MSSVVEALEKQRKTGTRRIPGSGEEKHLRRASITIQKCSMYYCKT